MKEIKLIAQPNDVVYYIEYGHIIKGKVVTIHISNSKVSYIVNEMVSGGMANRCDREVIGNTIDELLQNLKNEYLQRTSSSQPITT